MCSWWNVSSSSAIKSHSYHKGTVNAAYSDMMRTAWASLATNVTAEHQHIRKRLKAAVHYTCDEQFLPYTVWCAFVLRYNDETHGWSILITGHLTVNHPKLRTHLLFVEQSTMCSIVSFIIWKLIEISCIFYMTKPTVVFFYHFDCQAPYFQDGLFI